MTDEKRTQPETVLCETCGHPTPTNASRVCNGCWEVESRLRMYLLRGGANARKFVEDSLVVDRRHR